MDIALYIFFGIVDVLAILALVFKIFRWPFWEYKFELLIIAVTLSFISYLDRMILNIPEFDIGIQFVLYIIFFRYLIKVNIFAAVDVSAIGYLTFIGIQVLVYYFLVSSGFAAEDDAKQLTSLGVFIIQASSELLCFLVAWIIYRFNYGFAYIKRPPHERSKLLKLNKTKKLILIFNALGSIAICSYVYWFLNFLNHILIVISLVLVSLGILIYLSHKRDYEYD